MFGFEVYHPHIFLILTFMWLAEIIIYRPKINKSHETESFNLILISIASSVLVSSLLNYFDLFNISSNKMSISKAGLILYSAGLFIRLWARIELGKYFSYHIVVSSDQPLISKGPYRIFRHPLYIGLFLLTISVSIYLYNYIGFLFSLSLMIFSLAKRVKKEEQDMEKAIGERYIIWKKTRI